MGGTGPRRHRSPSPRPSTRPVRAPRRNSRGNHRRRRAPTAPPLPPGEPRSPREHPQSRKISPRTRRARPSPGKTGSHRSVLRRTHHPGDLIHARKTTTLVVFLRSAWATVVGCPSDRRERHHRDLELRQVPTCAVRGYGESGSRPCPVPLRHRGNPVRSSGLGYCFQPSFGRRGFEAL